MRAFLAASFLAVATAASAQPSVNPQQVASLMALAKTYGVVRYFHPSDSLDQVRWDRFLVDAADRMGRVADGAASTTQLEELFAPIVVGFKVAPVGSPVIAPQGEGPRIEWRHLGYGLETDANSPFASWRTHHDPLRGGKLKAGYFQHRPPAEQVVAAAPVMRIAVSRELEAQVPVSMPMSATKVGAEQKARLDALAKRLEAVEVAAEVVTRAQAHADGIALWNVARHFYPYWAEVKVDWEAVLRKWLAEQPATQSREQLRESLLRLAVPLEDGHGAIQDPKDAGGRAFLGISVRPLGRQWVVDSSRVDQVRAGDVVLAVRGKPAAQYFEERMALVSGSPQHKRWQARFDLMSGPRDSKVTVRVERLGRTHDLQLAYDSPRPLQAPRPPAIDEIAGGIYYVDVSRFDKAAFEKQLEQLRAAKGIVFDLRGYPGKDAVALVPYWITGEDKAQWMLVPRFDRPLGQFDTGWSFGWQQPRKADLDKPVKVLITDGRAIDYAESLAAYFPAQKTGPVIGEPTAGAAGNVSRATLPSGMGFFFSGMRVTRHDGSAPLHRTGVAVDEAVLPSVTGMRTGRDDLLQRAISVIEARAPR
jgi:C-terminal processing protease CtpA/Prc